MAETVESRTREEFLYFENFKNLTKENPDYGFKAIPTNINHYSTLVDKNDNRRDEKDFYTKYRDLCDKKQSGAFFLEEELARYVKNWHSTNEEKDTNYKPQKLTQDNYFNETNVLTHIIKDRFIKQNTSIVGFYLLDYILTHLEKRVFEKVLLDGITYQNDYDNFGLVGPILDQDFIEKLISMDINEKLNFLYKENTLGYSYIVEKLITFDLFIIYLVLKNFPFYILRRSRLENIFCQLKKFKSFPYPIGSIGMDLFKLLINELYLPGISLFQEVRETFLLDIIDPKILEINTDMFIKVIVFDKALWPWLCKTIKTENNNTNSSNKNKNAEDYKFKNDFVKNIESNTRNTNIKLNHIKELTFASLGVYSAFILYAAEDKKDEKEINYFVDILALFEKRYKIKKGNENLKKNIDEKNIINNLFNLIDNGLDSNFNEFSYELKVINDKLISKTKESHENTTNSPKDNINLLKYLYNKLTVLELPIRYNYHKNLETQFVSLDSANVNKISYKEPKTTYSKKKIKHLKNISGFKKATSIRSPKKNMGNNKESDDDEIIGNEELIKIQKCSQKIDEYQKILKNIKIETDDVLENYVANFVNLKNDYFIHLQEFDLERYTFSDEKNKEEIINFNKVSKIKINHLTSLYKQKYLLNEDQIIPFLQNLDVWKKNITPLYQTKLYKQYQIKEKKKEEIRLAKKIEFEKKGGITDKDKDPSAKTLEDLKEEEKSLERIMKAKLPFNYLIYLIPGKINKCLCNYIKNLDFIYKCTIGDICQNMFNGALGPDVEKITEKSLQLYLREAKHFFNLKIFKVIINTTKESEELKKFKIYDNYYYFYGGFHIESKKSLKVLLDDDDSKTIFISHETTKQSNNLNTIVNKSDMNYIDIINMYCDNEKARKRINNIEKYMISNYNNRFQIFVSGVKDSPNMDNDFDKNEKDEFLKRYVTNLINFDVKSMYYEANKIIVASEDFTLMPTFIENLIIPNCTYLEVSFGEDKNNEEMEFGENEEKENEENVKENVDNKNTEDASSFNFQIATFLDLSNNEN